MAEEKEITWSDIEKILEEQEKEGKERREFYAERLKEDIARRKKRGKIQKPISHYIPPSPVDKFSEKTEEQVDKYIRSIERKTRKKLAKLVKQEEKYLKKGGGLLGTPGDDYYRVKQRREILDDLAKALKRTWGGLEEELQVEKLDPEYEAPGLLSRILKYVKGPSKILDYIREHRPKKVKKASYAVPLGLFLIFLIFRKSSITGHTVIGTVTNNTYLSYFLVFILIICLIAFYLDKK